MLDLSSNRLSHAMSAEQFAAVKAELQQISENLHFLIHLGPTETEALYGVSDADKTFVRNCLTEMRNAGDILPAYLQPEEIVKDLTCGDQLLEIENTLSVLLENIRRNRRLANHEAYTGASVFYRLVNAAARSGSAPAIAIQGRLQDYHSHKKNGGRARSRKTTPSVN